MAFVLETLKRRAEFVRISKHGARWSTPGVVLQALRRGAEAVGVRVGFTASRKVGNSVERNRAKRRLRAAAEVVLTEQGLPGTDYVLVARRSTLTRPFAALLSDLGEAVGRTGAGRRVDGGRHRQRPNERKEAE